MAGSTRRFAVITGASTGIGLELARKFVENDFDLLVCADDAELARSATALRGGGAHVGEVRADLSTRDGVESLVTAVEQSARPVDALVLNAGVANGGPFLETSLEDDLEVIGLNVSAVVHLAKRLLPAMVARGAGRVLLTASTASFMPGPYYATYAASKAFDHSFAEALHHELRDTGVTVTSLVPGPTDTEFFRRSGMEDTRVGRSGKDDPATVAEAGFEAMMKGEHEAVATVRARAQKAMAAALPQRAKAAVHGKNAEPQDGQ